MQVRAFGALIVGTMIVGGGVAFGCSTTAPQGSGKVARAVLRPTGPITTGGTATFIEGDNGALRLDVNIQNAAPGTHGLHVHMGPDCANAAGHYSADGGPPYVGEYKFVIPDGQTDGTQSFPATDVTISSVVGHAMVFHVTPAQAPPDAGSAPPPKAACGVIQLVEDE